MLEFALKQKNLLRFFDFSTSEIFDDRDEVCTEDYLAHIGPIDQDCWKYATSILNGEALLIHGMGDQVRSWCHIDDFVDGILLCMTNEKAVGETFNLGNDDQVVTIDELARMVLSVINTESKIVNGIKLNEDVKNRKVSYSKARELLGYAPSIDIYSGIMKTSNGYKALIQL